MPSALEVLGLLGDEQKKFILDFTTSRPSIAFSLPFTAQHVYEFINQYRDKAEVIRLLHQLATLEVLRSSLDGDTIWYSFSDTIIQAGGFEWIREQLNSQPSQLASDHTPPEKNLEVSR